MPDPVGRDEILAQLRGVVDDAAAGAGRVLLLTGEAGIGKTTLLAEAARYAEARGASAAWGWGWPGDGAPAYWPWVQILRALALESPFASAAVSAGTDTSPASARFQLFDEVCQHLLDASRVEPTVLFLDDLHWADPQSLLLLDFLGRRLPTANLAVIGSYRGGPGLDDALSALAAHHVVLPLLGLPAGAVTRLVADVLGHARADEVGADVHRRTGGNPFFVQQLAWLIRDGRRGVPPGIREALRQRFDRLSPACMEIVGTAAVVQRFAAAVLARVADRPVESVEAALDDAVRAGILIEQAPGDHRFSHDLFREYLYDRDSSPERARIHQRAGDELEAARVRGAEVSLSELAWHYAHADPTSAQTRHYAVAAAREATARLAYEDAVRQWERALAAVGDSPTDRIGTLLELAEARRCAGDGDAAEAEFLLAAALARRSGSAADLGRAALGLHAIGSRSGPPPGPVRVAAGELPRVERPRQPPRELAAVLAEAHSALTGPAGIAPPGIDPDAADGPELLRLRVQASLARVLAWYDLDLPRARTLAADAVSAARRMDDRRVLAICLLALHNTVWVPSTAAHRRDLAAEVAAIGRAVNDRELLVEGQLLLATDLLELGDPAFRLALDEFLGLAEASGRPHFRYAALVRQAMLAHVAGRFAEAERLADRARQLGSECGVPDVHGVWYTQMWGLRADQGRQRELSDLAAGSFPGPNSRPARGFELLDRVMNGEAAIPAEQMARMFDEDPERPDPDSRRYVMDMVFAVEVVAVAGSQPMAERLYDALLPFAGYTVLAGAAVTFKGAVAHHLGVLAATMGRLETAAAHLRDAIATHERLGAVTWTLRSRYEMARMGLAVAGSRTEAELVMMEIAREARRLDMAQLADDAQAAGSTAAPPATAPGEFTRDGAMWTLGFGGETVRMRDAKGLRDLATLLAAPGQPVATADLMAAGAGPLARPDLGLGSDEIFDETARRQIRARLADLDAEITEAEDWSDLERASRARAEKDALIRHLSAAAGFAGGARRLGDQWERSRKAVTARIRDVIDRIERIHPALGSHLRDSVTTGTHCTYSPAAPMTWQL